MLNTAYHEASNGGLPEYCFSKNRSNSDLLYRGIHAFISRKNPFEHYSQL